MSYCNGLRAWGFLRKGREGQTYYVWLGALCFGLLGFFLVWLGVFLSFFFLFLDLFEAYVPLADAGKNLHFLLQLNRGTEERLLSFSGDS